MSRFAELLQDRRVIVADGATGTSYQERGLEIGEAPEEWLFKSPERVIELHRAFVEAGADRPGAGRRGRRRAARRAALLGVTYSSGPGATARNTAE